MRTTALNCFLQSSIVFISFKRFLRSSESLIDSFVHSFLLSRLIFSLFGCCSFFVCTPLHSVFFYRIRYNSTLEQEICVWGSNLVHYSIYMVGFQYNRFFRLFVYLLLSLAPNFPTLCIGSSFIVCRSSVIISASGMMFFWFFFS